jgi:diguanylate cyclase (GGDEF)-like protein
VISPNSPRPADPAAGHPADVRAEPDPLTRLPTRRQFLGNLGEGVAALEDGDGSIAVLFVDIDGFRRINRDLGHVVGDQLLFSAGRRLMSAVRAGDVVARAGGDEFVVMSSGLASGAEVVELAGAIMNAFDDPFDLGLEELTATVSVGVVVADESSVRAESLVTDAESALERDRSGTRRFEIFDTELRERIR